MRRRRFLQNLAAGAAGVSCLPSALRADPAPVEESSNNAPVAEPTGSLADVEGHTIVQTWHRTSHVEDGKMTRVVYGYSYPAFPPRRKDPPPVAFYGALLVFAEYWERQLHDASPVSLPEGTYVNMTRHAIARELMVRPGGVYPKYGAVDRDR